MALLLACILLPSSILGARTGLPTTDSYPWVAADDLDKHTRAAKLEQRVGIGNFTLDVESFLGGGVTGAAFRVTIVESGLAEMRGLPAVLKIQNEHIDGAFGTLRDESIFLDKVATVRHVVKKLDFGKLWVPVASGSLMGRRWSESEALLETMASGSTLHQLNLGEMGLCGMLGKGIGEFACDMMSVGVRHADLHANNVLIQPSNGENAVTVIDFGNAQNNFQVWRPLQEAAWFLLSVCPQERWAPPCRT